jgi:hypothetical protein
MYGGEVPLGRFANVSGQPLVLSHLSILPWRDTPD